MGIDAAGVDCSRLRKDGFFDPTNELIVGRPHLRRRCHFLDHVDTHAGAARGRSSKHWPQRNWLTPHNRRRAQAEGSTRAAQSSRTNSASKWAVAWAALCFAQPGQEADARVTQQARADAAQPTNKKINAAEH